MESLRGAPIRVSGKGLAGEPTGGLPVEPQKRYAMACKAGHMYDPCLVCDLGGIGAHRSPRYRQPRTFRKAERHIMSSSNSIPKFSVGQDVWYNEKLYWIIRAAKTQDPARCGWRYTLAIRASGETLDFDVPEEYLSFRNPVEIRIKPGEHGNPFRVELWYTGVLQDVHESGHSSEILRRVERMIDQHEGAFNAHATWEGSRLPPEGR